MSDLSDFIRARLDEDEAAAKGVAHGPWYWEGGYPQRISNPAAILVAECYTSPDAPAQEAEHIARHDPARVLRDIAAKRAIVEMYADKADYDTPDPELEYAVGRAVGLGEAVRHLAAVWSGHPDYEEAWKP